MPRGWRSRTCAGSCSLTSIGTTPAASGTSATPRSSCTAPSTSSPRSSPAGLRYQPKLWPSSFDPTIYELDPEPYGPFPESKALTESGDVRLVPIPGHTIGQIGVIVETRGPTLFLAADHVLRQDWFLEDYRGRPAAEVGRVLRQAGDGDESQGASVRRGGADRLPPRTTPTPPPPRREGAGRGLTPDAPTWGARLARASDSHSPNRRYGSHRGHGGCRGRGLWGRARASPVMVNDLTGGSR